ncbi:heavy metal translocatin [Aaosphaeria arxii CBS 175.79]|uniref:Heavy metal translocatin n=1 Tax=Aaosphaeria arxii CBS 175.79 TaxID=1450172 RepID=A0A6A5Y3L5_9PLEO|nr:heavy metal translocatin [Aaosphaeria arxii CBS 175.79]KAF2019869.1 heavy metal translocatin [Aaosphaeria arxii CBS 175.79]
MACCYIAASILGLVIRSCEALDINLHLQYNESVEDQYNDDHTDFSSSPTNKGLHCGVTLISISGMTCAACTSAVESAINDLDGVEEVLVSLPFQEARVLHNGKVDLEEMKQAITDVGYGAVIGERQASQKINVLRHTEELAELKLALRGLSLSSGIIFALGTGIQYLGLQWLMKYPIFRLGRSMVLLLCTTVASLKYGHWIFKNAMDAARHWRTNMHTLITASTLVGLSLASLNLIRDAQSQESQYYDSIIGVLLIVTIGRYMDLLSRRRATDTFAGLHSLLDQTSSVKLSKSGKRIATSFARVGDEIIVDGFNVVPCDCYIVSGTSNVNEAVLTGESFPKSKGVGDLLLAGSRNGPGRLVGRINQDFNGSFLAQLVRSVEQSLTTHVSVQHRVNSITQWFVACIFAVAFPTAIWEYIRATRSGDAWWALNVAGQKLMTILAAACPCALGLATPCAVMAGIDASWRHGILMLEGGETMERVRDISHIVMDKTGTLTRGVLSVSDLSINIDWEGSKDKLAALICAAEEKGMAAHPLAMAVFRHLLPESQGLWKVYQEAGAIRMLEESPGNGVKCEVDLGDGDWQSVFVGSLDWLRQNSITGLDHRPASVGDGSSVFVGINGDLAATLILQDTIRPDAKSTIDALKAQGIEVSMLTGDQPAEAARISRELGISVMGSAARPEVKLRHLKAIQEGGGKVLMVGDGMNDGPSLAAADVGVMMSNGRKCLTSGGSVLLLQPQLNSILTLLKISRRTMLQVNNNLMWAIFYNTLAVTLAIGLGQPIGLSINPPIAAAMMSMSSLFITMQGLILRTKLAPYSSDKLS